MPSIEAFQKLANHLDLVPMQIVKDFAPYSPDPDRGYTVAGFPPDVALRVFELGAGIPVDEDLNPIQISEEAPPAPVVEGSTVPIPTNWKEQHHLVKVRIAKAILGEERRLSKEEMDDIIEAEVKRRSEVNGGEQTESDEV